MFLLARCVLLLSWLVAISAHSVKREALEYITAVDNAQIHTPSNRIDVNSKFDLTFTLHKHRQEIRLTLEPNHDLLHEKSKVEYLRPDGTIARTESLVRADHRVYRGYAWTRSLEGWERAGWARVYVLRDGSQPLFEGAFNLNGDDHHLTTRTKYLQTKQHADVHAEDRGDEYMVVFRDSDHADGRLDLRSLDDPGCTSDELPFNTDPEHPIYSTPLKRDAGFFGSISTGSLFGKRDVGLRSAGSLFGKGDFSLRGFLTVKRQIDGVGNAPGNSAGVNLRNTIGSTAGCPSVRRIALVGVAADCTYVASFNSSDAARTNIISQINTASDVYQRTFNISLGLHTLTLSDPNCPVTPPASAPWNIPCGNTTITDRLNEFSGWRGTVHQNDSNAFWSLLSTCNTGSAVGLAWLGQLCIDSQQSNSGQTVSGANVVVRTSTEWAVIAHEIGHTFGAVHDCLSSTCSDSTTVNSQQCCPLSQSTCPTNGNYIMAPATSRGISDFSPCSVGNICSALGRSSVKSSCLTANKDISLISGSQCGNGIVEDGEDCDCGAECASNPCCGTDCKFKSQAQCDYNNQECCDKSCRFASAGTVCRASSGSCDPQETCTGTNSTCPNDTHAPDGKSCGNGLTCSSGQCSSRDLQCRQLMGSLTTDNSTTACDDSSCQLSCSSRQFQIGTCMGLNQNFLDGTSCSGGGHCLNGQCLGSSPLKEVSNWISRNKPLVIGLASVFGTLVILAIISCIWQSCSPAARRRKRRREARKKQHVSMSSTAGVHGGHWPSRRGRNAVPDVPPNFYNYPSNRPPGGGAAVRYA